MLKKCKNGHELSEDNVSMGETTRGSCKTCNRDRVNRSRRKRREEARAREKQVSEVRERFIALGVDPAKFPRFQKMEYLVDKSRRFDEIAAADPSFLNRSHALAAYEEMQAFKRKYPDVAVALEELGDFVELTRRPKKEYCPNGHERNEENTSVRASGGRICRVCHRERVSRYRRERGIFE